jgi:hypothetical protein
MGTTKMKNPDFVITDPPEVVAEKLRWAAAVDQLPKGTLSGTDLLPEDRRSEREKELADEGF